MDKGPIIFALLTLGFIAGASKYQQFAREHHAAKLKARRLAKETSMLEQLIADLPKELREKAKVELDKLKLEAKEEEPKVRNPKNNDIPT